MKYVHLSAQDRLQREKAKQEVKVPLIEGLSESERKKEAIIHRRMAWLYLKIIGSPDSPLTYERQELKALEWLLAVAQKHYE